MIVLEAGIERDEERRMRVDEVWHVVSRSHVNGRVELPRSNTREDATRNLPRVGHSLLWLLQRGVRHAPWSPSIVDGCRKMNAPSAQHYFSDLQRQRKI